MIPQPLSPFGELLGDPKAGLRVGSGHTLPSVTGIVLFRGTQAGELTETELPNEYTILVAGESEQAEDGGGDSPSVSLPGPSLLSGELTLY